MGMSSASLATFIGYTVALQYAYYMPAIQKEHSNLPERHLNLRHSSKPARK